MLIIYSYWNIAHLLILRWTSYNAFKLKFSMECARNDQNYRI